MKMLNFVKNNSTKRQLYFVIGPTSSGKTTLSVELAKKLSSGKVQAEIICCDSRQIYIDLNIGSGKATPEEMQGIPHHMLSVVELGHKFSVVDYVNMALIKIKEIEGRGNIPIVSGGTGFYIDALLYEYNLPKISVDHELRNELEGKSLDELWDILLKLDNRFTKVDGTEIKNNKNRVVRYIEIITKLGHLPKLEKKKRFTESEYEVNFLKTNVDRKSLKERIQKRTLERLEQGMLEEFKKIISKYCLTKKYIIAMGFEFSLMSDLINNKIDQKTFLEEFVKQEYQYARRQDTWFRRY